MGRLLFLCSKNRWRSPTAEQVFSKAGHECMSAGVSNDAEHLVTPELLEWADLIFVMERSHKAKLAARFGQHLKDKRIICLGIRGNYHYMDPVLTRLLRAKVDPFVIGTL